MPAPIRPSQVCATVPTTAAEICAKLKLIFLTFPNYVCQLFSYIFNEDGSVSTEFRDAASPFPAGTILQMALESAPMGWLLCNGQEVSRTTYAVLFAAWGTRYGAGNGSTTFNVIDLRGRVIMGADGSHPFGWTGGSFTHALILAEMPNHQHQVAGRPLHDDPDPSSDQSVNHIIIDDDWEGNQITKTTDDRGSGAAHENTQPSHALHFYVKY